MIPALTKDERYELKRLAARVRGLYRAEKQALAWIADVQTMQYGVCSKALTRGEDIGIHRKTLQRGIHGNPRDGKLEYPGLLARKIVSVSGYVKGGRAPGGDGLTAVYTINRDVMLTFIPEVDDSESPKNVDTYVDTYVDTSKKNLDTYLDQGSNKFFSSSFLTAIADAEHEPPSTDETVTVDADSTAANEPPSASAEHEQDAPQESEISFSRSASPSNPTNPTERMDGRDAVNKKFAETADDDEEHPTIVELERARTEKRCQKNYAIEKSIEWRELPSELRDRVKAVVKQMESEWEYWATHDEDGDGLSGEDRNTTNSFPCPSDAYRVMLAGFLATYTPPQLLRAWDKFLRRPQSFDGLRASLQVVWSLFEKEFETYVDGNEESANQLRRQQVWRQPPIEAFVAALHAERDGDAWIARCPLSRNHKHGDSNPSLVISQKENDKVVVRCRGGCDQREVWSSVVSAAREVAGNDLQRLEVKASKPKAEFKTDWAQVQLAAVQTKLSEVPEVQQWMKDWGITSEVANKLHLGAHEKVPFTKRENGETKQFDSPAVVTPHYDHSGNLVGLKVRAMSEKAFTQEAGSSIDGLFAVAQLDPLADEVLVLEGDKDVAIALSHGFNATGILSTNSKLSSADIYLLAKYQRIYLIGDQDIHGIEAMDKIAKRLPEEQVIRVRLPVNDIGEFLQRHQSEFKDRLRAVLEEIA